MQKEIVDLELKIKELEKANSSLLKDLSEAKTELRKEKMNSQNFKEGIKNESNTKK